MVLHGLKKPVCNDAHDNLMKEYAAVTAFVPLLEMISCPSFTETWRNTDSRTQNSVIIRKYISVPFIWTLLTRGLLDECLPRRNGSILYPYWYSVVEEMPGNRHSEAENLSESTVSM